MAAMIALASAKADSKSVSSPGLTGSRACSRITGTACLRIVHIHTPGAVTHGRKRMVTGYRSSTGYRHVWPSVVESVGRRRTRSSLAIGTRSGSRCAGG